MNYTFNLWDNLFAMASIMIGTFVAIYVYKLSKKLSASDKYLHEKKISEEIKKLDIYKPVILADVSKYHPLRKDTSNKTYYKQGAALFTIIPVYGVQFILRPNNDSEIPVGLVPFEWIEYVRECDSEDTKPIIICKFKGVKWHGNFKSPFKEINYIYKNLNYNENSDPEFLKYTTTKSKQIT